MFLFYISCCITAMYSSTFDGESHFLWINVVLRSDFFSWVNTFSMLIFKHVILSLSLSLLILYVAAGLRNRSRENKAVIVSEVEKNVWPAIVAGRVKPVIYKYFPLSDAAEAHQLMENSDHIGKILLVPQFSGWSCGSDGWWCGFKTLCVYFVAMLLCVIVL